jgi:hypothetical protein
MAGIYPPCHVKVEHDDKPWTIGFQAGEQSNEILSGFEWAGMAGMAS